ncbi:MAG TPA: twin-arginine translocase TatA/TatE family subunit [Euzebya sp.]|nr:twin-arginine translocase TatA/TatE family subunit [Euzebya sp.]
MGSIGAPEIIGIVVLALLLFGGRKLPELGSSVGKTITNFRKGLAEAKEEEAAEEGQSTSPAADSSAADSSAADPSAADSTTAGPADRA